MRSATRSPRVVARRSAVGSVAERRPKRVAAARSHTQAGDRAGGARAAARSPADVNAAEADGTTPLHWAVRARRSRNRRRRCSRPAPTPNAANRYGVTPLSLAAVNGNAAMIEALLCGRRRAPTRLCPRGQTVLMTAARTGNAAAVRVLHRPAAPTSTLAKSRSSARRR